MTDAPASPDAESADPSGLPQAGTSQSGPGQSGTVDPALLEILVCPLTKAPLRYDRDSQELISDQARLAYPIRDGIPIMLVDEARQIDGD